jgi:hypothetical protein
VSTPAGRPDPAAYLAPDGVLVPPFMADALLLALLRDLFPHGTPRGAADLLPDVQGLLQALDVARQRNRRPAPGRMETARWVTVLEAAADTGYSVRRVQQVCHAGQVRHRRVGRVYLVDLDDLHRHRRTT